MGSRGGSSHGGGRGSGVNNPQRADYRNSERLAAKLGITLQIDSFLRSKIRPEMVLYALKRVQEMFNRVPELRGFVNAIDVEHSSRAYASMSYYGTLNLGLFGKQDLNTLTQQYAYDLATKFHPEGTSVDSIIYHELGHALEAYIATKRPTFTTWGTVSDEIILRAGQRFFDTEKAPTYRRQGVTEENIAELRPQVIQDVHYMAQNLSGYAASKIPTNFRHNSKATWATWETLAEGIGEYVDRGTSASKFSQYIWEEAMKEVRKP